MTEKEIDSLLDDFDFARVKKTMQCLNWQYGDVDGTMYVPSVKEMRHLCRKLIRDAMTIKDEYGFWATGGFKATKLGNHIYLSFEVAYSDNEY